MVGEGEGALVGLPLGMADGARVMIGVGSTDGMEVGSVEGAREGAAVGVPVAMQLKRLSGSVTKPSRHWQRWLS
jgi:hypothetical protein